MPEADPPLTQRGPDAQTSAASAGSIAELRSAEVGHPKAETKPAPATLAQIKEAIEGWKWWVLLAFGAVTGVVTAWNAKANSSDLDAVKKTLSEQATTLTQMDGKIERLPLQFRIELQNKLLELDKEHGERARKKP